MTPEQQPMTAEEYIKEHYSITWNSLNLGQQGCVERAIQNYALYLKESWQREAFEAAREDELKSWETIGGVPFPNYDSKYKTFEDWRKK